MCRSEKNIHTTPKLENLPSFTFSGQSKRVLANLFKQYPPDDEELWGVRIEASGDTTDGTEEKKDDVFSRPQMSKVEITKRLEILSNGMRDSFKLKLVNFFPVFAFHKPYICLLLVGFNLIISHPLYVLPTSS